MGKVEKIALIATSILMVTSMTLTAELVAGGEPIFSSNKLAVWDIYERNQKVWDMEVDSKGRIYLVYTTDEMYYPDTYIVHSDDGGMTWSTSSRIDDVLRDGNESNDRSSQNRPRIAISSNDTVYVAWTDAREKSYFMEQPSHIRVAWSTDGENFSRSIRITPVKSEPTWDAVKPDIAINDAGRIFIAWLDEKDSGAYRNVWGSYSDDGGLTWSEMKNINDDGLYYRNHQYLRCVMHQNEVYVTWQDNRESDNQYRPYIAVSHDGGETFGENIDISDDLEPLNSRQWPSPAVDDLGNLYITWRDKRTGSDEIWFTRSEDKGGNFSQNTRLTVAPEGSDDWYPCTAATGDGIVGVVFQRSVPYKDTKDEGEIFFLNSSDGGRTWDPLLRVDDTDRYHNDLSLQERPQLTFDNDHRALSSWWDSRNYYARYRDVYFAAHSGPVDGPNIRPKISDMEFWSPFSFNPTVASSSVSVTFSCNYSDQNNDVPLEGFPRVHIFSDEEGSEPVLPEPVVMEKIYPGDIDHMDGVEYKTWIEVPYEGQVWWRVEVIEEGDPSPYFSDIREGPLIDATPPRITVISPTEEEWMDTNSVYCKVRVEDHQGGNVKPYSIKVRKSVNGIENLEKGVRLANRKMIDNNTYEAWGNVFLNPGQRNFIQFEAYDKVGNGPGTSEIMNIWVDPDPPFYTAMGPTDVQIYNMVNCTIQWMDHLPRSSLNSSGLNLSSIQYSYRTTSGELSEWMGPEGILEIDDGVYLCWVNLFFPDEGVYSFIKWRAADNLGTYDETDQFRIRVDVPDNYPPVFKGKGYPSAVVSETPHLFWDSAYDEEGDDLYYRVKILRYPGELQLTPWIDLGQRTFYDIPDKQSLNPGYYMLKVNATDRIGGYDILDHVFRIMDAGTPPPEDIPDLGVTSLNPDHGFLFSINSEELPPRSSWTDLPGTTIADMIWDSGGQVLDQAVMVRSGDSYMITYPDNASERGEEYYISEEKDGRMHVYKAELLRWKRSPSSSEMDMEYMVRIGSEPFLGDLLEWTNIGSYPSLTRDLLDTRIGLYNVQVMATHNGNYSRVTQGLLKVNDHNISYSVPDSFRSYRGKGMGFSMEVTNFATYMDNVTIVLQGTLADDDHVYLEASGDTRGTFSLPSQKIFTIPTSTMITITVYPDEEVPKGNYQLNVRIISEDGETIHTTDSINITITDKPRSGLGEEISDNLYKLLTDTFPFLESIEQSLLVPLFLLVVAVLIGIISTFGIVIYRKKFRKKREVDPYREQREVYKELYGVDPTEEQLKTMKETGDEEDFFSDIPTIEGSKEKPQSKKFDKDHLESEKKAEEQRKENGAASEEKENMDDGFESEDVDEPEDNERVLDEGGALDPDKI
ncbi:MAG: sialidase family protein [Thermoplasmatota archaeon]